jgi:hypothetical protein
VLVALLRQHYDPVESWNANTGANEVQTTGNPIVTDTVERLALRAADVTGKPATADLVRNMLHQRLDDWARLQTKAAGGGATLGYRDKATVTALLETPTLGDWPLWAVPNSLRETEPNVNLIIDAVDWSLGGEPSWQLSSGSPPSSPSVTVEEREDAPEGAAQ